MIAFKNFNEIDNLKSLQEKHKAWLKDYEGLAYSIAEDGKHKMKWSKEDIKYRNEIWTPAINCIKELKNRTRIEFDDKDEKKAKENLELTYKKLKENKIGFIRSTHKGKSDYLWVEFNRDITQRQKESFLAWVSPEGSLVDLNFTSSRRVFPVLYAPHWKHSFERELPIEYFEGEQIDLKSIDLGIKKVFKKSTLSNGFSYKVGEVFTRKGQAKTFIEKQPLFYDKAGLFWLWENKEYKWEVVDDVEILNYIESSTGQDIISSKNRTEIINSLKQIGRKNIPQPIKETWIQFKDTIVDINTGEEIKASPDYFVTNPIPWALHKERYVKTPIIDKIFKEWVGEKYIQTLHEIIAYCMLPSYPLHRLFCFIGVGLNGKSCFLRLLKKFLGPENVTSTELDTLLNSRFEVTRLYKKLSCVLGETNFSEMSKTSIIKKLTGQDTIGFEYKNKTPFEDVNYAKILIATNNLPTTTDKTIGFYRRWLIIDFPNQFSEKKDILLEIPDEEFEILTVKSLGILKDLLDKREFHNEGTIEDKIKKYEDKSDPLEKFMKEYIIESYGEYIWKSEFERKLNEWCRENRFRDMSSVVIGKKMKEKGIEQQQKYEEWQGTKGGRAWVGITWKQQESQTT